MFLEMKSTVLTRLVRSLISPGDKYTFTSSSRFENHQNDGAGLYLHIPFCTCMCPYCPYYKVHYDPALAKDFQNALLSEIDLHAREFGRSRFSSLYIGGGTPTLMTEELGQIIDRISLAFDLNGCIAVETTPADITRRKTRLLKEIGVSYISLGVQSYQEKNLALLGRQYDPSTARQTAQDISESGFVNYNIDLIFALPGETQHDLEADLFAAVECSPDQITCYPLFTFPYTTVGKYKKLRRLRMPSLAVRRRMYYFVHEFLESNGYKRSSVWSFVRSNKPHYSSVTRDYYVGFGPSAASYTGEGFYFNTFSIADYIKMIARRRPVALKMHVTERMKKIFWLYWRLYETRIPYAKYQTLFGNNIYEDFGSLLTGIKLLGMHEREDKHGLILNVKGCHWIHLAQNYYALNYVSKIWSVCQSEPWPERIPL